MLCVHMFKHFTTEKQRLWSFRKEECRDDRGEELSMVIQALRVEPHVRDSDLSSVLQTYRMAGKGVLTAGWLK